MLNCIRKKQIVESLIAPNSSFPGRFKSLMHWANGLEASNKSIGAKVVKISSELQNSDNFKLLSFLMSTSDKVFVHYKNCSHQSKSNLKPHFRHTFTTRSTQVGSQDLPLDQSLVPTCMLTPCGFQRIRLRRCVPWNARQSESSVRDLMRKTLNT